MQVICQLRHFINKLKYLYLAKFCNYKKVFFFLFITFLFFTFINLYFQEFYENRQRIIEISKLIKIDSNKIAIECESGNIEIVKVGLEKHIKFYLSPQNNAKRCEIVVSNLDPFPAKYDISFDIKQNVENPSDIWRILFQIHEFKDFGERWRCPPVSLENNDGKFRVFNRWDEKKITLTDRNGCVSKNGSIKSRDIGLNIPITFGQWQKFSLEMKASPFDDGLINMSIDENVYKDIKGGNVYNDKKAPFVKFGIYSPSGWSEEEVKSGKGIEVDFKNIIIQSSSNKL